jgi:hypothetical protein
MIAPPRTTLPSTIAEWEAVLIDRFLRIGANGDASAIRSLEITGETLAAASGLHGATADDAEAALRSAVLGDAGLWRALSKGQHRTATDASPNCFTYLVVTLLIDTLLDGDYSGQGQFRDRLRKWLETTRSMMQLSGVATMWRFLAKWLDARVAAGESLRRLVLPDPPHKWTQIGYTRCLSFPTRADTRFLKRVMASSRCGASDPHQLIRAISAAIDQRDASWGMKSAFLEFRSAYLAGTASTDHRFWRLVLRTAKTTASSERNEAVLELCFDEDARRSITVRSTTDAAPARIMPDIGAAMRSNLVTTSMNLSTASTRGVVFFRQIGMARWRAQMHPQPGATHIHLALATPLTQRVPRDTVSFVESGDWWLTVDPISERTADQLLAGIDMVRPRAERLLNITLADGVRVGNAWLGRVGFLPRISTDCHPTAATRVAERNDGAVITICNGVLVSEETVDGVYDISVSADIYSQTAVWSRRVSFVANAMPHPHIGGAASQEPLVREWLSFEPARTNTIASSNLTWTEESPASADILEAIYAAGRSGLSDGEMVDLVARGAAARTNTWSLLRSLQESGFIEARQRQRWRGRVWTLGKPTLVEVGGSGSGVVVADGAICAALECEFREVAHGAGGIPFRRIGVSAWSPPIVGATSIDSRVLAARLGWPVTQSPVEPRPRPNGLEMSNLVAEHHVLASSWDWNRRHFVTDPVDPCDVSLTRWVHPGGRDHDVYRVNSAKHESMHLTRNAAILKAHIVAGTPLFRVEGKNLVRTAKEGALPIEFARWLRLSTLTGSGAVDKHGYSYGLGDVELTRITHSFPGCVEGQLASLRSSMDVLLEARRSGGRTRVQWVDGTMAVAP